MFQSTSSFVNLDATPDPLVYGVFTTGENALPGSAVCAFRSSEVRRAFEEGPFKEQKGLNQNWLPAPRATVPKPRPGEEDM